jgi:hypothetical protein
MSMIWCSEHAMRIGKILNTHKFFSGNLKRRNQRGQGKAPVCYGNNEIERNEIG